jgi:MinD-like ATPase involved in chromosome partitioning or flagellar assembly
MTRIITITGAVAGVGKTHLAVNLSLELVRRGRQVGLFHVPDDDSPVERYIDIQPLIERRQQSATEHEQPHAITRGYLGIDVLSCLVPLAEWPAADDELLVQCIQSMDVEEGYDDFIVDTSSMAPRDLVGCCVASALVVLIVTPDSHSQAEAFALLRVLQLNGFSGELRLVVNRVSRAGDAQDVYQRFNRETRLHLGVNLPAPWEILEDSSIPRAERYRQAFSAVFPDSEAAAGIVYIADGLESIEGDPDAHALTAWWQRFIDIIRSPIHLPGNVLLDTPLPGVAVDAEDAGTDSTVVPAIREERR